MNSEHYKFTLQRLPYNYDALEPYIDTKTMQIHHDKHLKTYVDNLNKALENYPALHSWSLERLLINVDFLPCDIKAKVKNNAGGVYNHNLYFNLLTPNSPKRPVGLLNEAIICQFSSFENFVKKFKEASLNRFGSGYAFLALDKNNKLKIFSMANQDTPLSQNLVPILLVDVWEHAYYLKHQNKRDDYLNDWFNVVNWEYANEIFTKKQRGN